MKYIDYDEVNFEDYTTGGYTLGHCFFCGSGNVELYGNQVECHNCEAHGPRVNNWELAVKAWNDMPRLTGDELKKQRSCWKSRYRRERQAKRRIAVERAKEKRDSSEPRKGMVL